MQTYLVLHDGTYIPLNEVPRTREEAIALVSEHSSVPGLVGQFRIVVIDEFEVSVEESYEVEVFAIGLQHFGRGAWGLIEASVNANQACADFSPTSDDVALWLEALRDCWPGQSSDFICTIEQVEDFHVLQLFDGLRLLTSVTWNAPDADTTFRMPNTLDIPQHRWGDGVLADVGLLYEAVRSVNYFSVRK